MVKYTTASFLPGFNIPGLKCICSSFHFLFKNTPKLLLPNSIFLKIYISFTLLFISILIFWKNKLEGILKVCLVKVPVKVKLLIKKEKKHRTYEKFRCWDEEELDKKTDYFIPFSKQNFKTQSNNFTNHVFRSNRLNSTRRKLDSPCRGTWRYDFSQIKFWCETHKTVNTKNI